jgi:hypothetical protein
VKLCHKVPPFMLVQILVFEQGLKDCHGFRRIMTFTFKFGDDTILLIDTVFAKRDVPLGLRKVLEEDIAIHFRSSQLRG